MKEQHRTSPLVGYELQTNGDLRLTVTISPFALWMGDVAIKNFDEQERNSEWNQESEVQMAEESRCFTFVSALGLDLMSRKSFVTIEAFRDGAIV